ncbi:MAG: succinate dehydrogenase, cytochrome b556 subunit [Burkholderiales bacterium]|jgi:succinate dehydrogenase, cytochrome b556 subunit|uniref:succinate dehydrogenase, cytochrome b556 subunit n=1 Tax=uncultured Pigmentiphaga sp. TaxID=340361 RepID=UPI003440313A|nr:succinate dehydrogenase, cytochrome b556 subunit [Burkholderiales bacterium]
MPEAAVKNKRRPLWYNLSLFNLPVPGLVSIMHRISGAALFLSLPWLLYLFDASLDSPERYAQAQQQLSHPLAKLVLFGLIWGYAHHFSAGIRHLLLDVHVGIDLHSARGSARAVLGVGVALALLFGWVLLW